MFEPSSEENEEFFEISLDTDLQDLQVGIILHFTYLLNTYLSNKCIIKVST